MEFHCQDFPQYGVVLVPPTSPEYDPLLADIQRRVDHRVAGSPGVLQLPALPGEISEQDRETSAILVNRGTRGIAAIQQVWSHREISGRTSGLSAGPGPNPSVLLPFGIPEKTLKLYGYWRVIVPGSKRYLSENGGEVGDNSDVRPPWPDEMWTGGGIGMPSRGSRPLGPMASVTLTLDGVFFDDGGFVGPNTRGLWDQVVSSAEAHTQIAKIARQGHNAGITPAKILADVEAVTGPGASHMTPPPPRGATLDAYRQAVLQDLAWQIAMSQKDQGDERAVLMLLSWSDAKLPNFRKL